jgi:hypothetical protein
MPDTRVAELGVSRRVGIFDGVMEEVKRKRAKKKRAMSAQMNLCSRLRRRKKSDRLTIVMTSRISHH